VSFNDAELETILEEPESNRYIPIPDWTSSDGYNLMEKFVSGLRNPLARERLRAILQAGRRVFRQFKDTLREHREVEKLWFRFKEQEMRDEVLDWYANLMETWGIEYEEPDFEDTLVLVFDDFDFLPEIKHDEDSPQVWEQIRSWDKQAFSDAYSQGAEADFWYTRFRESHKPGEQVDQEFLLRLLTPGGELAAFAWGVFESIQPGRRWLFVRQLYVLVEYRGLGIGKALISRILEQGAVERVYLELPGNADILQGHLESIGFKAIAAVWVHSPEQ
jgi:GNAT superfamily N-acetyltransferase